MITTVEITVSRVITDDGRLAVTMKTSDHYNAVELLGLLEVAKLRIYREMENPL